MAKSIWTQQELNELITAYKQALLLAASGQSYRIANRELARQPIDKIREQIVYFQKELAVLEGGSRGPLIVRGVVRR